LQEDLGEDRTFRFSLHALLIRLCGHHLLHINPPFEDAKVQYENPRFKEELDGKDTQTAPVVDAVKSLITCKAVSAFQPLSHNFIKTSETSIHIGKFHIPSLNAQCSQTRDPTHFPLVLTPSHPHARESTPAAHPPPHYYSQHPNVENTMSKTNDEI
jgi:hypothetical protein